LRIFGSQRQIPFNGVSTTLSGDGNSGPKAFCRPSSLRHRDKTPV